MLRKRRNIDQAYLPVFLVGFVVVVLALVWAQPVKAEPKVPTIGQTIPVKGTVLCDKLEQSETILAAYQVSVEAGITELHRFMQERNERGFPACGPINGTVDFTLGATVSTFEDVKSLSGLTQTLNVIPVLYKNKQGAMTGGFIFTHFKPVKPPDRGKSA